MKINSTNTQQLHTVNINSNQTEPNNPGAQLNGKTNFVEKNKANQMGFFEISYSGEEPLGIYI